MPPLLLPFQLVLLMFAGWLDRHQLHVIDYLQEENRWECLRAADFLSVEVVTFKGLITYYVLFFIDIAPRKVHVAAITPHPDNAWMTQIARNVTDTHDGFFRNARYLIMDRDTKYSDAFRGIITRAGTNVVRLPTTLISCASDRS